jgi:hypothetical protein
MEDNFEYNKEVIIICISKDKTISWSKENGEKDKQ